MALIVNDTFTDVAGTLLTAHTGEAGATWTLASGFTNQSVISNANRLRSGAASGQITFASGIATTDGEYAESTVQVLSAIGQVGVFVRGFPTLAGNPRGYMWYLDAPTNVWTCARLDNSTTFTTVGSTYTSALSVGSHTIRVTATGTGASVALELKIDGAVVATATDSSASRITTLGHPGIYFGVASTDSTGMHVDAITFTDASTSSTVTGVTVSPSTATVAGAGTQTFTAAVTGTGSPSQSVTWSTSAGSITSGGVFTAPASTGSVQTVTVTATSVQDGTKSGTATVTVPATVSMAFTTPIAGKVNQLSSGSTGTATISTSGTYSGTAPDQWRVVQDGTNTPVTGFDWTAFTSAPAAGAFSQTIAGVPKQAGWLNVQVRNSGAPTAIAISPKVGTGVLVVVDGQSYSWLWFSTTAWAGDSTLTPDPLLRVTGIQASNVFVAPATATMNGAIACGNALVTACGCPVALIDGSWNGSGLTVTAAGGQWISGGAAGNAYTASAAALTAAGSAAAATIWIQGQGDAGAGVSQSAYYTAFGQMTALRRAAVGATNPYVIVTHPRYTAGLTDAAVDNIRQAHVQACGDANNYRVDSEDLPMYSDGVHLTATGFATLGRRCAQAVLKSLGLVSTYRGPRISSVVPTGTATVFDVNLTHDMGTDFTPTSAITGFRVLDGGSPVTISSVARQTASTIRITLAATPSAAPTVQYLYGLAPDITGVAKDNGALTLPLEYNSGVVASASTVTGVTVSPSTATVAGAGAQTFTASVAGTGSPSQSVTWSASAGSITSGGVFTAPAATGSVQTVTVTATSQQDGTKSGTATVTVPATAVVVAPTLAGLTFFARLAALVGR